MNTLLPPSGSRWLPAIVCSVVVCAIAAGGSYMLRTELLTAITSDSARQENERNKLATRIDALQSSVETISGEPKTDTDAISSQFADMNTKLSALSDRVTVIEKKTEPAPAPAPVPAAAPVADSTALKLAVTSGKPFATELATWQKLHPNADAQITVPLAATAQSGIPSDAELNTRLRDALDDAVHSTKVDDVSFIGKMNTHLAGLVSIKKSADAGPYAKLRVNVMREDSNTLIPEVEKLSDQDRKPLENWLTVARARRDALIALSKLDAAEAP